MKEIKITQVVVFQPDNKPAIFNIESQPELAKIHAGLTDGVTKVAIEYKNGKQVIFIGMPYTINTEPAN